MDTKAAVGEFASVLRLGTAALKKVISEDRTLGTAIEPDINELLYLLDRFEEIGERIAASGRSDARRSTS